MDIYFQHLRAFNGNFGIWRRLARQLGQPYPLKHTHGITLCVLRQGDRSAIGLAFCSYKDQFSKKTGREKAQSRALKALKGK
jgi:hypothetical protein